MVKAVRTDGELECPAVDAGLRAHGVELAILPEGISEGDLCAAIADADLLLMCYTPITARVIEAAPRLKGIVKYGVGIDAIDIPAAMARGIPVVNIPDYAEETVAEAAFALMIALARRLPAITHAVAEQGWVWPEARWLGRDIAGATLGLVGCGRIGRSLARMAGAGFRARVLGYDPYLDAAAMRGAGIEKVDALPDLLAASDFISIHTVLNQSTRGMIGAAELACMKRTAILINVSRGALVDEAALVDAVMEERLGGVGLDTYSLEPLRKAGHPMSPLYRHENVILLPHLAFFTVEAMQRLEVDTLTRCEEILQGRPVTVRSNDPRLRAQRAGIRFA